MAKLRAKINAFFYKNRDKGIRNLMLFYAIGNVLVYLLWAINQANPLFLDLLSFDRTKILAGQVWRVLTYPLTYIVGMNPLLGVLSLLFYFWCGRVLEQLWGTLRFNCYYLLGVLLTAGAALLLGAQASALHVNLSIFLAVATVMPDERVRIWFVLPVKMKWIAWVDVGFLLLSVVLGIITMLHYLPGVVYLDWLLPIVALLNYMLFFGRSCANLLPDWVHNHPKWKSRKAMGQFYTAQRREASQTARRPIRTVQNYRFKCTVCGRTDVSDPKLEFRYCSRCAGYRCYCADHIHNHAHITE